jgi:hypothetical protein
LALLICLAYALLLDCMLNQSDEGELPAYVRRRTLVDLVRR